MDTSTHKPTWDTWLRNCHRIERALRAAGVTSRPQLLERYDKHGGVEGIKGIGPALRKQLETMLNSDSAYGPIEWNAAMPHIEWGE